MNKKLIVIINGPAGVGKDTLINEFAKTTNISVYNYSTIGYFKEIAKKDFNWDGIKNEKGRKLLSEIKRIAVEYNDLSIEMTMEKIRHLSDVEYKNDLVMFIHIREKEETKKLMNKLKEEGYNVTSLYVHTTREIEAFNNNYSDEYAADWKKACKDYEMFLVNDDLDETVKTLSSFINIRL